MKKLSGLIASLILLTGCASSASGVTNLNANEFSIKVTQSGVVTLDVRTPGEFMTGHIDGAQNIDFESGEFAAQIDTLDKNGTYAVYCRSGNRSGQAVALMHDAGFHNVFNLNGGIIEWTNAGLPLVNN